LKPAIYFNLIISTADPFPPRLRRCSRIAYRPPLALAPTDDRCFDWAFGFHTVPGTATPSAQKRDDIGADVILAKQFKGLAGRWVAFMHEGPDSLLPCRHAVLRIRPLRPQ
jgi:hypothetical protein